MSKRRTGRQKELHNVSQSPCGKIWGPGPKTVETRSTRQPKIGVSRWLRFRKRHSKEKNYKHGYTKLPEKYYHQFDAKAGDVVIFDAGLLHQGSCKGKRTHLFARCVENFKNNVIEDNLKPDALLDNVEYESANYNWDFNQNYYLFKTRAKSLLNLFLYYFPIIKIIKYTIDIKKKKIHFHYSIFQK